MKDYIVQQLDIFKSSNLEIRNVVGPDAKFKMFPQFIQNLILEKK